MAELVDAHDSKSCGLWSCGFDSHHEHQIDSYSNILFESNRLLTEMLVFLIGNEQTKEATVDEIKEYYDNKEFYEKDIKIYI